MNEETQLAKKSQNNVGGPNLWAILSLLVIPIAGVVWFGFVSVAPLGPDQWWHSTVIAPVDTPAFAIANVFHIVGSTKGMAVVSAIILAVLLVLRRWPQAATLAGTMITVVVAVKGLKMIVDRPRPVDMLVTEDATSFPSGHTLGAAAIATVLVCFVFASQKASALSKSIAVILGAAYVLTMMWSRTALHVHWITDTIAGALIGIVVALIFARIFLFNTPDFLKGRGKHAL